MTIPLQYFGFPFKVINMDESGITLHNLESNSISTHSAVSVQRMIDSYINKS